MRESRYRRLIAEEAARLMIEEDVSQYLDAKKKAAKNVLRGGWARRKDLPSNGEIREAIRRRTALSEGDDNSPRLFAMRITALEHMEMLASHSPRLIGSVATGHARRGSDIDIHVFPEDIDTLEGDLRDLRSIYEREEVHIRTSTGFEEYVHFHVEARFPVELSVYAPQDLRIATRSSTDGRPIDRVSRARLVARIREEHPAAWERWDRTGALEWRERPRPGRWDALLAQAEGIARGRSEEPP